MKSSHIDHNQRQEQSMQRSNHLALPSSTDSYAWITLVTTHLHNYYHPHMHDEDIQMLDFSLHHIFSHVAWLYLTGLPALTHETTLPFRDQLEHTFLCWQHIRTLLHALERLKVIAHLLNVTAMSIMHTLNNEAPPEEMQGAPSSPFITFTQEEEEWAVAFRELAEHLHSWQHSYTACNAFSTQFSTQALSLPTLEMIDKSFDTILFHSNTLFGDILPDLRATSIDDDEALSTCLFDLLQQNDALLIAIDSIIEPLTTLLQYHAITTVLR